MLCHVYFLIFLTFSIQHNYIPSDLSGQSQRLSIFQVKTYTTDFFNTPFLVICFLHFMALDVALLHGKFYVWWCFGLWGAKLCTSYNNWGVFLKGLLKGQKNFNNLFVSTTLPTTLVDYSAITAIHTEITNQYWQPTSLATCKTNVKIKLLRHQRKITRYISSNDVISICWIEQRFPYFFSSWVRHRAI